MPEQTADERRAAQAAEYGRYVAKEHIYIGTALAFAPGDPVPVSHVDREVVDKSQVREVGAKAAPAVKSES